MRKDKTSSLKPPLNASCKLFHCSHTVVLYVGLPSSSQQRLQIKKKKHSCFTRCCTVDRYLRRRRWWVLKEWTGGGSRRASLPALLLRSLLQRALWSRRALEPLRGDGGLMGHALPHHVAFPPQCDFLHRSGGKDGREWHEKFTCYHQPQRSTGYSRTVNSGTLSNN